MSGGAVARQGPVDFERAAVLSLGGQLQLAHVDCRRAAVTRWWGCCGRVLTGGAVAKPVVKVRSSTDVLAVGDELWLPHGLLFRPSLR
jgi:hypothetical protein